MSGCIQQAKKRPQGVVMEHTLVYLACLGFGAIRTEATLSSFVTGLQGYHLDSGHLVEASVSQGKYVEINTEFVKHALVPMALCGAFLTWNCVFSFVVLSLLVAVAAYLKVLVADSALIALNVSNPKVAGEIAEYIMSSKEVSGAETRLQGTLNNTAAQNSTAARNNESQENKSSFTNIVSALKNRIKGSSQSQTKVAQTLEAQAQTVEPHGQTVEPQGQTQPRVENVQPPEAPTANVRKPANLYDIERVPEPPVAKVRKPPHLYDIERVPAAEGRKPPHLYDIEHVTEAPHDKGRIPPRLYEIENAQIKKRVHFQDGGGDLKAESQAVPEEKVAQAKSPSASQYIREKVFNEKPITGAVSSSVFYNTCVQVENLAMVSIIAICCATTFASATFAFVKLFDSRARKIGLIIHSADDRRVFIRTEYILSGMRFMLMSVLGLHAALLLRKQ